MTMPLLPQAKHFAVGGIEGGEQSRCPIPFVVMGPGLATSTFERQAGLRAIQGLDLTLLIQAQHQSVLRWVQVQTYDIGQLFGKLGIPTRLEGLQQMRF